MSIADVRETVMDAFAELPANVYDHVPPVVMAPAVFVFPDDPYLEPTTIGSVLRMNCNFRLIAAVAINDTKAALNNLENLCVDVLRNLPDGAVVGAWDKPSTDQVGPSDLLVSTMTLTVTTQQEN